MEQLIGKIGRSISCRLLPLMVLTLLAACSPPQPEQVGQPDNAALIRAEAETDTSQVATVSNASVATDTLPAPANLAQEGALSVSHGPISGEVSDTSVVLWARSHMTGTLRFEVASDEAFSQIVQTASADVDASSDFTGKVRVERLQPDQRYFYRAALTVDEASNEPVTGQFVTAPAPDAAAAFNFVFSSCLGGQNYCRNPETGWVIFDRMIEQQPDFFLLTGDSVYVTTACSAEQNVPGAEGPYNDLAGFRTRYRYHLEDPPYARFLSRTPVYVTWDDHEVLNDFGGPALKAINPQRLADGKRAYFEYWPLLNTENDPERLYRQVSYGALADFFILDTRSYRDPNVNWDPHPTTLAPKSMLGAEQFDWLQKGLSASTARWKFIVSSVPLAYPTGFPQPQVDGRDGWANYTEHSGYESELQALLFFIIQHKVGNVVFLAGDTHWPYALSYDPDRDGTPNFYELASSPMSAIPLAPPEKPDPSFNPSVLYAEGEFQGDLFNFGHIALNESGDLTFRIVDWQGTERYTLTLQPE